MFHRARVVHGRRLLGVVLLSLLLPLLLLHLGPVGAARARIDVPAPAVSLPASLTYTFTAPSYQITRDAEGQTSFAMPGFRVYGLPGDPALPAKRYLIALPPLVPLESVSLEISAAAPRTLPGSYEMAPVGPNLRAQEGQPGAEGWGPHAATIVAGKNRLVYGRDALYPPAAVELLRVSQMRKWRVAELLYTPLSANPLSGRVQETGEVTVTLRFDVPPITGEALPELGDTLADDRAAEAFLNYDEARPWYESAMQPGAAQAKPGYVIITTRQIAGASQALEAFRKHKETLGYNARIITEDDYGTLTGLDADGRADKVRQWLINHVDSDQILYVLLVGNPDPHGSGGEAGAMPMKLMPVDDQMPDTDKTPSDFYFANLKPADPATWDWMAEVFVGRIPVYQADWDWAAILDRILRKTIAYEKETDIAWRRSALLPMAFLNSYSDTAELAEDMRLDYLEDAGFKTHTLYWHGAVSYSAFNSSEELVEGAVRARWAAQPFGIVVWYAHGSKVNAGIYDEHDPARDISGMGAVIHSRDALALRDDRPALTFQASCQTGWPEAAGNLGYALLKNGAVGTVSGSRDTYSNGSTTGNDDLAYNYAWYVTTRNQPIGKVLYWIKDSDSTNSLAYNLYGDPGLRLLGTVPASAQASGAGPAPPDRGGSRGALLLQAPPVAPPPDERAATGERSPSLGRIVGRDPDGIISTGQAHSCAVQPDGRVDCQGVPWQNFDYWGRATDQTGTYAQVSAGENYTCGLLGDGRIHCWGQDADILPLDHPGPFTQITAGDAHLCALRPDGGVECWGDNNKGQAAPPAGPFTSVSAGREHTCALRTDGGVTCWGAPAAAINQSGPFTQIDAGRHHTCGLRPDGSAVCWGEADFGETASKPGPFTQIDAGDWRTCGLLADGNVACWGAYDPDPAYVPTDLFIAIDAGGSRVCGVTLDRYVECWDAYALSFADTFRYHSRAGLLETLTSGRRHACALATDGSIECWGDNRNGDGNSYGQADAQGPWAPYTRVSAGLYDTCGLKADGSVHCWGRLEDAGSADHRGPFVQVSTSYLHSCGLLANGDIDCWGNNDAGQAEDQYYGFVQVSTGMQHSCGLTQEGRVECWGRNIFGQANDRKGPYLQLDTGFFHTCALRPDGSADCWGSNHYGQSDDRAGPFTELNVGWFHSCGLKTDGSVECWGNNDYGQATGHDGPFVHISTNYYHSLGLQADGKLVYWGDWMKPAQQPGPFASYQPPARRMAYRPQTFGYESHYTAVHLADMTGSSAPEVLIGNRSTGSVEVWQYLPDEATLEQIDALDLNSVTPGAEVHDIQAGDFDHDGDIDIVAGLRYGGLIYAANPGGPGFSGGWAYTLLDGSYTWQVLAADFNDDGHLDIFQGVDYGPINTFYGDGAGAFTPGNPVQDPEAAMRFPRGFNALDVNDDGLLDLIGTDGSFLRVFLNPGDTTGDWNQVGLWDAIGSYPCCDPTVMLANTAHSAGDVDHNGTPDQVALHGSPGTAAPLELLLFKGFFYADEVYGDTLYWDYPILIDSILAPGWGGHAGLADLDGDGYLDIHVGGWDNFDDLLLYFGDGRGGFRKEVIPLGHGVGEFNSFATGDLDQDGVPDLVTNAYSLAEGSAAGFEVLFGERSPSTFYLPFLFAAR